MTSLGMTATALITATLAVAGGAAGAAIHATMTARVDVACPVVAVPTSRDQDLDAALRRFMSPPAPPTSGNPRY